MLIEVIILLILVAFVLSGYRKGLLMSLCTLLILVLSALGASLAQEMFTPRAVAYAEPIVAQAVETQLQTQLEAGARAALEQREQAGLTIGGQTYDLGGLADLLERFGLDVEDRITEGAGNAMQPVVESAAEAIAHAVVPPIMELLIYLAAYLILYLVLHSVTLVVNLVDHLPVIRTLNHLGGAVMGLLSGLLLLTLISTVFARTGFLPETVSFGPLGSLFGDLAARFS